MWKILLNKYTISIAAFVIYSIAIFGWGHHKATIACEMRDLKETIEVQKKDADTADKQADLAQEQTVVIEDHKQQNERKIEENDVARKAEKSSDCPASKSDVERLLRIGTPKR